MGCWGYEGLKASRDTDKKENRERYSTRRLMGCLKRHVIESSQPKLKLYSCWFLFSFLDFQGKPLEREGSFFNGFQFQVTLKKEDKEILFKVLNPVC